MLLPTPPWTSGQVAPDRTPAGTPTTKCYRPQDAARLPRWRTVCLCGVPPPSLCQLCTAPSTLCHLTPQTHVFIANFRILCSQTSDGPRPGLQQPLLGVSVHRALSWTHV